MAPRTERGARKPPSAAQFDRLVRAVERLTRVVERNASEIEKLRDEQRVQLTRMGQLQAELDAVKHAWAKMQGVR